MIQRTTAEMMEPSKEWMDIQYLDTRVVYFAMKESPNGYYVETEFTDAHIRKGRRLRFFDKHQNKYRYFRIAKRRKYWRLGHVRAWLDEAKEYENNA